jgi:hypothetical protein
VGAERVERTWKGGGGAQLRVPLSVPPAFTGCVQSYAESALTDALLRFVGRGGGEGARQRREIRPTRAAPLRRYREDLGGVLLTVEDVEVAGEDQTRGAAELSSRLRMNCPYSKMVATARALVFAPRPGHVVTGTVHQVSSSHIGALVAGTWNATVRDLGWRGAFRFNPREHTWDTTDGSRVAVRVGSRVRLSIESVRHAADVLALDCSLAQVLAFVDETAEEVLEGDEKDPDAEAAEE